MEISQTRGSYFKLSTNDPINIFNIIQNPISEEDWKKRKVWDALCFGDGSGKKNK